MKKKAPAFAGLLAAAVYAAIQLLQPQTGKPVSGDAAQRSSTLEASSTVAASSTLVTGSEATVGNTTVVESTAAAENTTAVKSTVAVGNTAAVKGTAAKPRKADAAQSAAAENTTAEIDPIKVSGNEGIEPDGYIHAKVTKVTDGDTIRVTYMGKEYRVRLLDIDTPETVKAGVPVQPYGKKASDKLKEILLEKEITLVFEKDIDDRYDRLLAYALLEDGTCVNAFMVEEGYARVEVVKPNTVYKNYFTRLQENAIKEKRGLWSLPEKERPFILNKDGIYIPRYYNEAA